MEAIDKQEILSKTNYGADIYAHILRKCYPDDEVVMRISGRDCGLCRNPFANGERTLHIFIVKSDTNNVMSNEYARHHATDGTIPDGDALSFAELQYHQSGNELLETINKEMNLHIGEESRWYNHSFIERNPNIESPNIVSTKDKIDKSFQFPAFSFFHAPITNTKPNSVFTLLDAYNYIIGNKAKDKTLKYRHLLNDSQCTTAQIRKFKSSNFDYCTFSGTFTYRSDKALILHSGLLCVDFDHIQNLKSLQSQLLQDKYFETQLMFRSPSGDGLKWIIEIDISQISHANFFRAVANYLFHTYSIEADQSGKDISRACFLPHDPNCFINDKYLNP